MIDEQLALKLTDVEENMKSSESDSIDESVHESAKPSMGL